MEIAGDYLGESRYKVLFEDFRWYWSHFFAVLRQMHCVTFVQRAVNLWAIEEHL